MKLHKLLERFEGSKNSNWKGDSVKERGKHLRQETRRGKATKCSKCGSTKDVEWAQMNGGGWKQLCKSCHSKYDRKDKNFKK